LALNVDFSSPNPDPQVQGGLRTRASKRGILPKKSLLSLLASLALADRHTLAAYRNNNCSRQAFEWFNIDDLERPWIPKIESWWFGGNFWLQRTLQTWIATKWKEID